MVRARLQGMRRPKKHFGMIVSSGCLRYTFLNSKEYSVKTWALVMVLIFASAALAQRGFLEGTPKPPTPIPTGPTPRMADGKPNFSGVWNSPDFGSLGGALPLQPWAQKVAEERKKNGEIDDPEGKCLPGGVPRISPYPMKMVQTPDLIVMLFEGNVHSYRQFFLDGRAHDKTLDPSFMGSRSRIGKATRWWWIR